MLGPGRSSGGPQYLDMPRCLANIARVSSLSLSGGGELKSQTFSRLLATLSFHQKCSIRLKCTNFILTRAPPRSPDPARGAYDKNVVAEISKIDSWVLTTVCSMM